MNRNIVNVVGNAMNTIPLTFNEHQISRTVIGGRENNSENTLNISVILLNGSGSQFKVNIFENLLQCNFRSVVSVEHDAQNRSIDDIAKKYHKNLKGYGLLSSDVSQADIIEASNFWHIGHFAGCK